MTKDEAMELLDNLIGMVSDSQDNDYDTALKMAIEALSAERVGKWIPCGIARYRCSQCGKVQGGDRDSELNYCCNCGARMEGEEE